MTREAIELLTDLAHHGVRIEGVHDRLRLSPRCAVTPELVERVKRHKAELLPVAAPGDDVTAFGAVNPGWRPDQWTDYLRRLARCCERHHPNRAKFLRAWAGVVEWRSCRPAPTPRLPPPVANAVPEDAKSQRWDLTA